MAPFQYDTFNPNTGTIAELMQAGARARAQAARAAGLAQANAAEQRGRTNAYMVGSLGNIATDLSGQIIRHYDGAPGRELQKQQLVANKRELAASEQGARETAMAKGIMPFALKENADGVSTFDRDLLTKEFTAAGLADRLPGLLKGLDDADAASLGLKKAKQDFAQKGLDGLLRSVEASGATPDGLRLAADYAVKNGLYSKQEAEQVLTFVGNDPAKAKLALQRLRGEKPQLHNAPAGSAVFDANNPQAGPIATVPKPEEHSAILREYQDAVAQGFKGTMEQYQNTEANRKLKAAGGGEAKPYFTYQTTFDAQGRPTGAIRFDARGGPPQFVNVSEMTGGGQLKGPPGTLGQQTITNEAASDQLDRLMGMFNAGAKDMVGPIEGRARHFSQGVPGVDVNKTFSDFDAASSAFQNAVIKSVTGAQMSEPEAKRIMRQVPTPTDKPMVWMSKATQTAKNLQDLAKRTKSARPDGAQAPAPPVPAPAGAGQKVGRFEIVGVK